jgi:hypothetical protein
VKEDASNKERALLREVMQMKEQMDINKAAIDNHKQKHSHKPTDIYIGAYYP